MILDALLAASDPNYRQAELMVLISGLTTAAGAAVAGISLIVAKPKPGEVTTPAVAKLSKTVGALLIAGGGVLALYMLGAF